MRLPARLLRFRKMCCESSNTGEFERVGGSDTIQIDVRVVGATNVDLPGLAGQGRFRADLLDRWRLRWSRSPPLRARPADILALSTEFGLP